ncbi:hypothetical protein H6F98_01205 [Microcoleus sp. FACHB-SPT15]|uniref:hypothetical protein n=1 Tax=Microcoleus sp. FACHB-SPT15 TaxID=2692830 RepID=UPI00177CF353|nr:hypothetical protein [Microcoleus sp. FACHB-SPT15]MBD1804093.1 hypothetical protein [Microcoleus sp. FACHB-SPT15]
MTLKYSLPKSEAKKLLSGAGLTLLASGITQPAFSQSLPPYTEDGTDYQIVPQLPIITNLDLIRPSTSSPERFPNEFGRKRTVTRRTTSDDEKFKLVRRLSPIRRTYRIPSPDDTEFASNRGGRAVGVVELVQILNTETGEKFNAAIPLCSIRDGQLAYPEFSPNICSFATSNQ